MTILSSEFLGWNLLFSRFFIGTYYGMLATLPIAPSQLLSIRVLLLEDENKQGKMAGAGAAKGIFIAGVSGFLIAQFAIFLSIYCLPLYTVWFKPHVFNFLLPPFLIWHYLKIVEFDPVAHLIPNYKYPIFDPRVRTAFLESFLLQIINPIVLPNPVFTRLMSIFLFRYSHIPMFVFGSLIGWLGGQLLFISLSWLLLSRLQLDSPNIYRIVKRIVHWAFPPIIMGICLSYMSRVSMVPLYKKTYKNKKILSYNLWPDICYNRNRMSRSTHFMLSSHQSKLRNQTNAPFNTLNTPLHKQHFSQYFFEVCIRDGKQRISHNYPISVSVIQNDLKRMLRFFENQDVLEKQWEENKQIRLFHFNETIKNKVINLDKGIENVLEKRLNSIHKRGLKVYNLSQYIKKNMTSSVELSASTRRYIQSSHVVGNYIRKSYDTRLGNFIREKPRIVKNESPWFINQNQDTRISLMIERNYLTRWKLNKKRLNRLKEIISKMNIYNVYFHLYKKMPIWKSRSKLSSFYYEFQYFKKSLTRRRRRKYFMRSLVRGATPGRSRNIAGIFFQFLETKPRSSFFLRSKEIVIDHKENLDSKKRVSQTASEKYDFSSSHSARGPALIAQAFIRKYIKLPTLIIGKNLVRLLLMQSSEWNQDWAEWAREKYIYCYYNGNYVPDDQLPPHWLGNGLQIKILSPLYLTPWRPSKYKKDLLLDSINPMFARSSYINIWGQETNVPFGEVQHIPFLKPIVKGLILFSQHQLAKILQVLNKILCKLEKQYHFIQSFLYKAIGIFDKSSSTNSKLMTLTENTSLQKNILSYKSLSERDQLDNTSEEIFSLEKENIKTNKRSEKKLHLKKKTKDVNKPGIEKFQEKTKSLTLNEMHESNSITSQPIDNNFLRRNSYLSNTQSLLTERNFQYDNLKDFPTHLILKRINKYIQYQKIKIHIIAIQQYQKLIALRKSIFRAFLRFARMSHQKHLQSQRNILRNIKRYVIFGNENVFKMKRKFITFLTNRTLLESESNKDHFDLRNHFHYTDHENDLSNAYILHKIWQNNLPNRLSVKRISMNWKPDNPLQDHIQTILNQQGLLKDSPQDINLNNLQEWLRPFRRYTPSPEMWHHLSPDVWRNVVNDFWVKTNSVIDDFQYKKRINRVYCPKYLSYYKPLFEKSNKMIKRSQFNLLINSYTNSLKNHNINDLLVGWQTDNRQNIQFLNLQLINNKSHLRKNVVTSTSKVLGLTNTRANGLVLSFRLIKSFNGSLISKKNLYISSIQPLYQKYKNIFSLEENELPTFKKRVSFRPIVQYRWKSEEDRFKVLNSIDIIRKVKSDLKNAVKKSILAKKNKLKSAAIFAEKAQEAALQWKTLNLSPFTSQIIKKRQAKVLDDEMLMHSIVTSFLKFKSKCLNTQYLGLLDPSINQFLFKNQVLLNDLIFTPEELLLPRSLREYKILSCFNFQLQQNPNKLLTNNNLNDFKINEQEKNTNIPFFTQSKPLFDKYEQSYSHQRIKRYLWPTYRVEDLACINRCLINTANQARFSSLRIRFYPNLVA
jgi:Ycf1